MFHVKTGISIVQKGFVHMSKMGKNYQNTLWVHNLVVKAVLKIKSANFVCISEFNLVQKHLKLPGALIQELCNRIRFSFFKKVLDILEYTVNLIV